MSNINNNYTLEDYTIALDRNGKVLFYYALTSLEPYYFTIYTPEAETIIHGNILSSNPTPYLQHANVRNIFTYDEDKKRILSNYFTDGKNDSGESVTVSQISAYDDLGFKKITINGNDYLIKDNTISVSLFGVNGDGTDETDKINDAIACAINNGCKLLFNGAKTYTISKPIQICTPVVDGTTSAVDKEFCIDFSHCRITVADGSTFNTGGNLPDSMIYVNVNFTDTDKKATVQNVQLYPGIYQDSEGYKTGAETGLYLDSASQIHFENIKILDTKRGVYIPEKYGSINNGNISMDNIQISKTRNDNNISFLDKDCESEANNAYSNSILVGIDCEARDCEFSNIIVIDYLIGMRVGGENNDVYGAHVWNTYSPQQFLHSVGFINEGTNSANPNKYKSCMADKFHIGWLSGNTTIFELINCRWLNREETNITYKEGAYGFYIPDGIVCNDGKIGSNIETVNCYMEGSDLDNDACFTNFCNRKDHSIDYTGTTSNVFYAPIPEMQKFVDSENNIHDSENNVTFNQYGKIKTKPLEISNTEDEKFNVYKLNVDNFDFVGNEELTFSDSGYMDNITNSNGTNGTIRNGICTNTTITKVNEDIEITVHNHHDETYNVSSNIKIDLNDLGYQTGDVGCLAFDYYTEAEDTSNGDVFQNKEISIYSNETIVDYFTGDLISSISLEQSSINDSDDFKSMVRLFKITDFSDSMEICIGHGERIIIDENNNLVTDENGAPILKGLNQNPIIIKNLRVIKIPSTLDLTKLPKYYLETEENYRERVANAFSSKNSTITKNASDFDVFTIPAYHKDAKLAFVSLPFKTEVTDKIAGDNEYIPPYSLYYTGIGRPRFSGNIISSNENTDNKTLVNPAINIEYDSGNFSKLYVLADSKYPSYSPGVTNELPLVDIIFDDNESNDNDSNKHSYIYWDFYQSFIINDKNSSVKNRINLPCYNFEETEEPYLITNLLINPYGYHFESLVDAEYSENEKNPKEVKIPLYANGEIRLMMKNAYYSTELPTFIMDIEYSLSQSETD